MAEPFTKMPNAVWLDERLTLRHIKVLGALYSFKRKDDVVWPTREKIAERCGLHIVCVSQATTELAKLGWLTKEGDGGRSAATRYRLHVPPHLQSSPETVAESATVSAPQTVAESATVSSPRKMHKTVADSATQTVAESATGKEQSIEQRSTTSQDKNSMFHIISGERDSSRSAEKKSPPPQAAEAAPTAQAAPAQLAREPMPWDAEDDDDLPPWEREQAQQQLPPWADFPPPDEPPSHPAPPAPPEDAPPPLALVAAPETAPAKPKKQKTKNNAWCDCPPDVEKTMWDAWMAIRRAKNMPMHEKTLLFTRQEAAKAGITLQQAAEICVQNAWAGFKAYYITRLLNNERQNAEMEMMADKSPNESLREYYARKEVERFCPSAAAKKPQPAFDGMTIDVNAKTVNNGEQFLLEKLA